MAKMSASAKQRISGSISRKRNEEMYSIRNGSNVTSGKRNRAEAVTYLSITERKAKALAKMAPNREEHQMMVAPGRSGRRPRHAPPRATVSAQRSAARRTHRHCAASLIYRQQIMAAL